MKQVPVCQSCLPDVSVRLTLGVCTMADQDGYSRGFIILSLFTLINFAAFVGIAVYHIQYEREIGGSKLYSSKDIAKEVLKNIEEQFDFRNKRELEPYPQIKQFIEKQRSVLVKECQKEVTNWLVKSSRGSSQNDRSKRQTVNTAGNELASIFGEIAKTEVDILTKYCKNGSFVCLPGQKGEAGSPGVQGAPGSQGPQGTKGDTGPVQVSPPGQKGEPGLDGTNGTRGLKGDPGSPGADGNAGLQGPVGPKGDTGPMSPRGEKGDAGIPGVPGADGSQGPAGQKGQKGEPSDSLAPTSQCCTSLSTPNFPTQVQTIRVIEGSNVTLNCDATSYPPPTITWNPTPGTMDKSRTKVTPTSVNINNAQTTDGHVYTCLAKNALGQSQKQFIVNVFKHIKFGEIPTNYTVMVAKPVTLECKIEGPLSPHISWYKVMKDGSRMLLTNGITPIVNGSQLHIDHVTSVETGEYICSGSNGVETVEKTAYIHIYGPPHIIPPGTVTAVAGTNITLKCETDSYPSSTITWKYPPGVTNAYKEADGTLMVLNANPRDITYFMCIATNQYGTDQATLQLKVTVPASVVVTPGNADLTSGTTNLAIECKASGDAPLAVSWTQDGKPITTDGHHLILPGNVLLISQATNKDIGKYTCTATNSLGSASGSTLAFYNIGSGSCSMSFSACNYTVCGVTCPANCAADPSPVYGYKQYSMDSSICKAAIQAGTITDGAGGLVTWSLEGNATAFQGTNKNGIDSKPKSSMVPVSAAVPA